MELNENTTLQEIKEFLKEHYHKGLNCPACKQYVKLYKRKLNSVMARTLIRLHNLCITGTEGYYHVKEIVSGISDTGTNDFSKLLYWGLIEEKIKDENSTKTRTSGYWKVTPKGSDFVLNKMRLAKHVYIYNTKEYGFSEETTNIIESLNNKFNYEELMQPSHR